MIDGDRYLDAIEEMKMILVKPCADRLAKVRTIRALFKRLCIQIAPEAEAEKHCPPEFEEQQIKKIVAELEGGVRYLPESLMILSNMQTESTVTPQQIRVIQSRIRSLGFSTDVMGKILYNLFAKSNITSLTKTEAALLLRIWSSPGAMWWYLRFCRTGSTPDLRILQKSPIIGEGHSKIPIDSIICLALDFTSGRK